MTEEAPRTCVIPNCGKGQPRTAKVGFVCGFHLHQHADMLKEIPDAFAALSIEREQGQSQEVRIKYQDPPAPINLDALSLLDPRSTAPRSVNADPDTNNLPNVHEALATWCRVVHEEIGGVLPEDYLTTITAYLHRHADHIAAQPWIDDYWSELSDCYHALIRVSHHERPRKIGRCYLDWKDDVCDGALIQQPGTLHTKCQRCEQEWTTPRQRAVLAVALKSSTKYSTSTGEASGSETTSQSA